MDSDSMTKNSPIDAGPNPFHPYGWNDAIDSVIKFMNTHAIGYGCPGSTFIHQTDDDSLGSDRFMWIREFEKWKR